MPHKAYTGIVRLLGESVKRDIRFSEESVQDWVGTTFVYNLRRDEKFKTYLRIISVFHNEYIEMMLFPKSYNIFLFW